MDIQSVKQRFGIIGQSPLLNNALETAIKVAPTDMNVLIQGESGVGKESFSKIIHFLSTRKHAPFIAVNCGAIPEGTIDSELFGHEKGSFTGATDKRKGYFESVNGGTIFLDEVGELPLGTQARLLRILENGEFIKVGSSQVQKTDVRLVAATNRDLLERARQGKFREDLYYRLATVPLRVPKLAERKQDIYLLFRKFSQDFAEQHHRQPIDFTIEAQEILAQYPWPGNIRQLKNLVEQISVIESKREIDEITIQSYLPAVSENLPSVISKTEESISERDIMYKFLFDMKSDLNDLKKLVHELINKGTDIQLNSEQSAMINRMYNEMSPNSVETHIYQPTIEGTKFVNNDTVFQQDFHEHVEVEESLSLEDREKELIQKALEKHRGKRKYAAEELGISERTLYRKIKEYNIQS